MKRSEMLDVLWEAIQDYTDSDVNGFTCDEDKVLQALEDVGMLPPMMKRKPTKEEEIDGNKHYVFVLVHEWEPEDENTINL
jgi:hypothetical protein